MILVSVASVLLTILKVIGIILLSIIGLVVLLILLILFCPISYRLSAVHNDEETTADVKVGFLIIKALANFTKGKGLDYSVKALFVKLFPRGDGESDDESDEDLLEEYLEEQDANEQDEDEQDTVEQDTEEISALPEADFESSDNTEIHENIPELDEALNEANDSSDSEEELVNDDILCDDEETDLSEEEIHSEDSSEKKSIKQKISDGIDKISDKADEVLDKTDEKLDLVDKKYNEIMAKVDHVLQFLDRDYVERTIERALKIVKRLFGTIKPKKSKGYLHMGLKSSADTGMMLGKLAAFYPMYGRWLTIEPDFYNKVIEGELDIKGRIYLFRVVGPALRMVLTRDFWRTYKLAKKI
jgi:predicted RND superfamily exporter protein